MKYNIAICGTFNVENYGDVMFPEVFKTEMQKRGLDFNLFLFSPGTATDKTLAPGAKVYSVSEMSKIHAENHLDAVIIGGGALVHYSKIPVKLGGDEYFSDYNIYDSWYTPIAFAAANNIKVIFNLPQVPYAFPQTLRDITRKVFNAVQYISVRDEKSSEFIKELYSDADNAPDITVCPDSVCDIAQLIPYEQLAPIRKNIFDFEGEYAVLQFNPQKPADEDEGLLKVINRLISQNMKVVLLPLGYTHNDDGVLRDFNNKYGNLCHIIDQKLNVFEIAAMLAGCSIYIGSSFHGSITSIAYGKTAISYNYISPRTKNAEIFRMYGVGDFVAENAAQVYDILDGYFNGESVFTPDVKTVTCEVEKHFDKIFDTINSNGCKEFDFEDFFATLTELLPKCTMLETRVSNYIEAAEMTDRNVKNLENILNENNKTISALTDELEDAKKQLSVAEQQKSEINANYINAIHSYNSILNSFFWKLTSPLRKVSQKFKDILVKNKCLLSCAIYAKGFLKGGFKGGKRQLENYRKEIESNSRFCSTITKKVRKEQENFKFSKNIKFSILVPLYNTPENFLVDMIKSVQDQTYKNWELCLADGSTTEFSYVEKVCKDIAKTDVRIKYKKLTENKGISENTNECIKMSTGDYIALFDHDDILHPSALFECMKQICDNGADYVYTDEATFLGDDINHLISIHYKPDFSYYNLLANNYICHFSVFSAKLIDKAGMFRSRYDGSQDHDIILRLTDAAEKIIHIPKILYFWRSHANSVAMDINSKKYAIKAGQNAVHDFLLSKGIESKVTSSPAFPAIYRIEYEIKDQPLVSIIIATKNNRKDLVETVTSIKENITYTNYEIIITDNGSTNEDVKSYYNDLKNDDKIKVLHCDFNTNSSKVINFAVSECTGDYLLLLHDDTKIITPNFVEEMLMYAQKDDVGAVGAKLYFKNKSVQHAGYVLNLGNDRIAGHSHREINSENLGYMGKLFYAQNIMAVSSACLMVKKSKYYEAGGFDESLTVAYNDVDFCLKLDEIGYKNIFNPFCEMYHYEHGKDLIKEGDYSEDIVNFKKKWQDKLSAGDPYYNPNFSLDYSYVIE